MSWIQVSYLYDGSLAGFLTCVFEAYTHREEPADFTPFDQAAASFYPQRAVEADREKAREENEVLLVQATGAAIALGEATAMALKNGHTNGETEAALEYAREIKHKQKDFLTRQAAKSIT